jgi:hypothetical protein
MADFDAIKRRFTFDAEEYSVAQSKVTMGRIFAMMVTRSFLLVKIGRMIAWGMGSLKHEFGFDKIG